ncbi:MAG: formylglycine-generating enzyme family protein [Acidobacteriota bacterium]|nr:formylglycine-generating enzyme family protein [Acidobacteriota bacterium]
MSFVPLFQAFLAGLAADGIPVGIRDYQRIALAFHADRKWSFAAVRDTLAALLVKDREQKRVFDLRFRTFFEEGLGDTGRLTPVDLAKALRDLRSLQPAPSKTGRREAGSGRLAPPPRKRRLWLLASAPLLLLLLLLIPEAEQPVQIVQSLPEELTIETEPIMDSKDATEPVLDSTFGLEQTADSTTRAKPVLVPPAHPFSLPVEPESAVVHSALLRNDGDAPFTLEGITLLPEDQKAFTLPNWTGAPVVLQPGQSRRIWVRFEPPDYDNYQCTVRLETSVDTNPLTFRLEEGTSRLPKHVPPPVPNPVFENVGAGEGLPTSIDVEVKQIPKPWLGWLWAALIQLTAAGSFFTWLRLRNRAPRDAPAACDPQLPQRRFSFASIGGEAEAFLDEETLNAAADLAGHYAATESGTILDARRTVRATIQNGGLPRMFYQKRVAGRTLLLLEDERVPTSCRTPLPRELAAGLTVRGVEAIHGIFEGSPATFATDNGTAYRLADLEHEKAALSVLLFTDGAASNRRRLTLWPRVAWLHPPHSVLKPAESGSNFPTFPANRAGVLACLGYFSMLRGPGEGPLQKPENSPSPVLLAETSLSLYLEHRLGDVLLWAADCALLQPCSAGLAGQLRQRFHAHLKPEDLHRFHLIPGTQRTPSGFRFSREGMTVLRPYWLTHRDETAQIEVLGFILDQVKAARPEGDETCLAVLSWEAVVERLKLEHRPDELERFAQIAAGPSGSWLKAELEGFALQKTPSDVLPDEHLPLRSVKLGRRARYRLNRVNRSLAARPVEQVRGWEHLVLAVLTTGFLITFAVAFYLLWQKINTINWQLNGADAVQVRLERLEEGSPLPLGTWGREWTSRTPVEKGSYRLVVSHSGLSLPRRFEIDRDHSKVDISINRQVMLPLVTIPSGSFFMGSPENEEGRFQDEVLHQVHLTRGFYLGATEVTWAQYEAVMEGAERPDGVAGNAPVTDVTWNDAEEFCRLLTERERDRLPTDWVYALPTEAQWEYAARAGSRTRYSFGDDDVRLAEYDWFDGRVDEAQPVAALKPNGWGLYDLHGNVLEWCRDRYGEYEQGTATDPLGPSTGLDRVVRGGGWVSSTRYCRVAYRLRSEPGDRDGDLGFRVALVESEPEALEQETSEGPGRMQVVWLEPGRFMMGSPESEKGRDDNEKLHEVTISKRFAIGKFEVTQAQYEAVMKENPSFYKDRTPDHPVENVPWEDAMAFCKALTLRDRELGRLPEGYEYSLPTEAQWEYAARAGATTRFCFGDDEAELKNYAWYGQDLDKGPQPVGSLKPNAWGLYNMHGNVVEWCWDWFDEYEQGPMLDPKGPGQGLQRVVRSGGWFNSARYCRSANRRWYEPGKWPSYPGFRVAVVESVPEAVDKETSEGQVRMQVVWLDPGRFMMGSPKSEKGRDDDENLHGVTISKRFAIGKYEVTQAQYGAVMKKNPSFFKGRSSDHPVENVSWEDAMAFCRALTRLDRDRGLLPEGYEYNLPTEAQWEYAARAGSTTRFCFGDDEADLNDYAWHGEKWEEGHRPIGGRKPNAWGLYDMHGNVWEWCRDWYSDEQRQLIDPLGPDRGLRRVVRGGSWSDPARICRSANRFRGESDRRGWVLGFRVVVVESGSVSEGRAPSRKQKQ